MEVYLNIAQIIVSTALGAIIMLQVGSSGGLGGSMFGGAETSIHRTRRGVERTLFNMTIILSIAFFAVTLLNVIIVG
ncbi:MAG: preprotein translocase subunit SecG [Chloroflexi bacterium]|nr:preprotein translocase subunit SecG [Chloroflexota bacterium]